VTATLPTREAAMIVPRCGFDRPLPSGVANSARRRALNRIRCGAENQRHLQDGEIDRWRRRRRRRTASVRRVEDQPVDFAAQADDRNAGLPARPDAPPRRSAGIGAAAFSSSSCCARFGRHAGRIGRLGAHHNAAARAPARTEPLNETGFHGSTVKARCARRGGGSGA